MGGLVFHVANIDRVSDDHGDGIDEIGILFLVGFIGAWCSGEKFLVANGCCSTLDAAVPNGPIGAISLEFLDVLKSFGSFGCHVVVVGIQVDVSRWIRWRVRWR